MSQSNVAEGHILSKDSFTNLEPIILGKTTYSLPSVMTKNLSITTWIIDYNITKENIEKLANVISFYKFFWKCPNCKGIQELQFSNCKIKVYGVEDSMYVMYYLCDCIIRKLANTHKEIIVFEKYIEIKAHPGNNDYAELESSS
jgi:hypothetical protein